MVAKHFVLVFAALIWKAQAQCNNGCQNPSCEPIFSPIICGSAIPLSPARNFGNCASLDSTAEILSKTQCLCQQPAPANPICGGSVTNTGFSESLLSTIGNRPAGSPATAEAIAIADSQNYVNQITPRVPLFGSINGLNTNICGNVRPIPPQIGIPYLESCRGVSSKLGCNNLVTPVTSASVSEAMSSSGAFNNLASSTQAVSIAETSSTNVNPSRFLTPNMYGGLNTLATPSSVSVAEATSSVNVEPNRINAYPCGACNNLGSSTQAVSIAEANSINLNPLRSPNIYGGLNTLATPSTVSVAQATSSVNVEPNRINAFPCGNCNNLGSSTQAVSIAEANSMNINPLRSPNIYGGLNTLATPTSVSVAEATSSVNVEPNRINAYPSGAFSNLGSSTQAVSIAEANSVNINPSRPLIPNFYGGLNTLATPSTVSVAQATSSVNVEPNRINAHPCGTCNNLGSSTQAVSIAEANSMNINPLRSPNIYGGLNNLVTPTSVSVAEATSSVSVEPSISSNPYTCGGFNPSPTPFLPSLPSINPIYPGPCGTNTIRPPLSICEIPPTQPIFCGYPPMSSNCYEMPNIPMSIAPFVDVVDRCNPCAINYCGIPQYTAPVQSTIAISEATAVSSSGTSSSSAVAVADASASSVADTSCSSSYSAAECASGISLIPEEECLEPTVQISTSIATATAESVEDNPIVEEMIPEVDISSPSICPTVTSSLPLIELSPITLEVHVPSTFSPYSTSCFCNSMTGTVRVPTYELQIPATITAQMSCSLEYVPSTVPVISMNIQPC